MTLKDNFSEQDWQELVHLPIIVASMISAVDYSTMSENKEFLAFADFIRKTGAKRKRSPFIAAIIETMSTTDLGTFQAHCTAVTSAASGDKPVDQALARVKAAARLVDTNLDKKTARSYKDFIVEVALVVARAHKESVLPFANPISTVEDFHIRRLQQALGV